MALNLLTFTLIDRNARHAVTKDVTEVLRLQRIEYVSSSVCTALNY